MTFTKLQSNKYVLPLGFTIIISMMVFTSFYATGLMKESSNFIIDVVKQKNINQNLIRTMSQAILQRSTILVEMIETDDPFVLDELYLAFNAIATEYVVTRQKLEQQNNDTEFLFLLARLKPIIKNSASIQHDIYELIFNEKKDEATKLFVTKRLAQQKKLFHLIDELESYQSLSTRNSILTTEKNNSKAYSTLLSFDIIAVLISILLALYILKRQRGNDNKLTSLARTDTLTNLPNRSAFIQTVDDYIQQFPELPFTIIFFDIDYFKSINDNYGHEMGDQVLRNFTTRVSYQTTNEDFFARLGGDEFVLILRSVNKPKETHSFISRLSQYLDTNYLINKTEIFATASMGVCMYPDDGNDTETLLRHADIAMYSAKKAGRNGFAFFSQESNDKIEREHEMSHSLHSILNCNNATKELRLVYQPLMNISDGDFTECEALLRWKNSKGESVPTDEFIELAEKTNLIEKINLFVIQQACKQQFEWQQAGIKNTRININLSGNKAIFDALLYEFKINLKVFNLSPDLFGIELTERTLFDISEETILELDKLRKLGVKISMDDFGTGYSSLSYLKKLPITTLKIDKAFISGIPDDKNDLVLVKTIINMAQSLKLEIVAEGVETAEQLAFLKEHSCNIAQGYFFHRPLEHKQITELQLAA